MNVVEIWRNTVCVNMLLKKNWRPSEPFYFERAVAKKSLKMFWLKQSWEAELHMMVLLDPNPTSLVPFIMLHQTLQNTHEYYQNFNGICQINRRIKYRVYFSTLNWKSVDLSQIHTFSDSLISFILWDCDIVAQINRNRNYSI